MKIIFALSRVMFIAFVWTVGYSFWSQRLMVALWGFNPLASAHWTYIWKEWQTGWVIQTPREWFFVIALFSIVPLWFVGWTILCSISWWSWFKAILMFPVKMIQSKIKSRKPILKAKVTRKKSYKQTRPPAVRVGSGKIKPIEKIPEEKETPPARERSEQKPSRSASSPSSSPAPQAVSKPTPTVTKSSSKSGGSIMDILRSAGYRLISDVKISGKKVDFVGVSEDHILLCLVDAENGDWLADEERFNDEEPLWFSESNHRISPVRIILNAREAFMPLLPASGRSLTVKPMVVVRQGTIINAEDMLDVWNGLGVSVCRFDLGGPDEIHLVQDVVSNVSAPDEGVYRDISGIFG